MRALLVGLAALALAAPSASGYGFDPVTIAKTNALTEIPPEIVDGRWYLSSDHGFYCSARSALVPEDCTNATPATWPDARVYRRSYYGTFSAVRVGRDWITANHGENKNEPGKQNTWAPFVRATGCWSGVAPGDNQYRDCWQAYAGFVGTSLNGQDLGPAVWPAAGYATATTVLGHGVLHPSIVRAGGWLYMAYYDTSLPHPGFRMARAKVSDHGRRWSTWVESRHRWVRSLPGRHALNWRSPSHESTPMFKSASSVLTIARTTDGRFASVEQGHDLTQPCVSDGRPAFRSRTRFRLSRDATHWSRPRDLSGNDFDGCDFYPHSRVTYAKLMNAAGTSTKLINLRRFHLLGVQYGGQVWRVRVRCADANGRFRVPSAHYSYMNSHERSRPISSGFCTSIAHW